MQARPGGASLRGQSQAWRAAGGRHPQVTPGGGAALAKAVSVRSEGWAAWHGGGSEGDCGDGGPGLVPPTESQTPAEDPHPGPATCPAPGSGRDVIALDRVGTSEKLQGQHCMLVEQEETVAMEDQDLYHPQRAGHRQMIQIRDLPHVQHQDPEGM
ncbi:hypothetical protein NDU88_000363 [Pleurodeles waltl]|uniref:Uncharacterized protein n=1 Tax=Pleurodeles waltl TaxID=8319 RepID=A0AAV7N9D8_PLEWA|nr:hypothetical protein NDU88_000363 [Pleurodeles waltl]